MDGQADGEKGTKEGIGAKIWGVTIDGEFDRTVDTDVGAVLG